MSEAIQKERIINSTKKYKRGFIIAFLLLFIGVILEYFIPNTNYVLKFPYNACFGLIFILNLIFLSIVYKNSSLIKWFSGVYAAIPSIVVYAILIIAIALFPKDYIKQNDFLYKFGFENITRTWFFLLVQLFFLSTLGFTAIRRIAKFKKKDVGFVLNHVGLFLIILAGSLGSSDIQKFSMQMVKNRSISTAFDDNANSYKMPFLLKLIDFDIEQYNPQLVIVESKTGKIVDRLKKGENEIKEDAVININDFSIKVLKYYETAVKVDNGFVATNDSGSYPAAYIQSLNHRNHETIKGWISCGNNTSILSVVFACSDSLSVAMLYPAPKKYSSLIEVYTKGGNRDTVSLEVNKPLNIKNWKIYQVGYNSKLGRWSNISIVEVVRDPWFPLIFLGIFMLMAGAFVMFWTGVKTKYND